MKSALKFLKQLMGRESEAELLEPPSPEAVSKRVCVVCTHISKEISGVDFAKCEAPQNMVFDHVTGKNSRRWDYCSTHRDGRERPDLCGKDGKWFAPVEFVVVERAK